MNLSHEQEVFSSGILRLVGYGLLLMAFIDLIFLLIPLQLMNPVWELQTIGEIIEKTPISLLGLVLVYYGERSDRAPIESWLLRWLSWISLTVAIMLFLTIPLSITDSFRIYYQENTSINTRVVEQIDTIQGLQKKLETANSSTEISAILQQKTQQSIQIPDSVNSQELKTNIINNLQTNQEQIRDRAKLLRDRQRSMLLKNCLKWNFGALIAAILYLLIWQNTLWARLEINPDD